MVRLILIDGHALIHRAYHAYPPLTTSKGELVNAAYGFTSILLSTIRELQPKYVAVAFDKKGPTFRHKKFKEYKGTRVRPDKEMLMQIPRIKQIVKALNLPIFEERGFEADDVIGTLARQTSPSPSNRKPLKTKPLSNLSPRLNDIETIIVTGDQDALQLIDDKVKVYMPPRGRFIPAKMYDKNGVVNKLGVEPGQIVDYKALVGDSSDNIPGVTGIGPKTAQTLLGQYKTLANIYKNLANLPNKIRVKLGGGKENAILSQELAQIHFNAPIKLDLNKCVLSDYNKKEIIKLFEELEFRSLIKRLPNDGWEEEKLKINPPAGGEKLKITDKQDNKKQMELF